MGIVAKRIGPCSNEDKQVVGQYAAGQDHKVITVVYSPELKPYAISLGPQNRCNGHTYIVRTAEYHPASNLRGQIRHSRNPSGESGLILRLIRYRHHYARHRAGWNIAARHYKHTVSGIQKLIYLHAQETVDHRRSPVQSHYYTVYITLRHYIGKSSDSVQVESLHTRDTLVCSCSGFSCLLKCIAAQSLGLGCIIVTHMHCRHVRP